MNNNQQHKSTPAHWAAVEAYAQQVSSTDDCLLELRSRVEALEGKYETQRLATLEWGKDVEKLQRWNDQHLKRIERLEGIKPKMVDLQLTPEQEEGIAALLRPNRPALLVDRVGGAIFKQFENKAGSEEEARAAIRVIATWLREQGTQAQGWAMLLEQEASNA